MKILVYCPTYYVKKKLAFFEDSKASFDALLSPDGVTVDKVIGTDNPHKNGGHKNTLHQYQQARKQALDGGYDALVTFEHDMIVPADGLVKLWDTPADVVYGLYVLRHGSGVVNAMRYVKNAPHLDSTLTNYPDIYEKANAQGWIEVSGVGMGFTLIRRAVLEKVEFRATDGDSYPPDWGLAVDCQKAGIKSVCRFDVKCGHIDPFEGVIWPGRHTEQVKKVKVLQFVVIEGFAGRTIEMQPGREYEIPAPKYYDLMRAGMVTEAE